MSSKRIYYTKPPACARKLMNSGTFTSSGPPCACVHLQPAHHASCRSCRAVFPLACCQEEAETSLPRDATWDDDLQRSPSWDGLELETGRSDGGGLLVTAEGTYEVRATGCPTLPTGCGPRLGAALGTTSQLGSHCVPAVAALMHL